MHIKWRHERGVDPHRHLALALSIGLLCTLTILCLVVTNHINEKQIAAQKAATARLVTNIDLETKKTLARRLELALALEQKARNESLNTQLRAAATLPRNFDSCGSNFVMPQQVVVNKNICYQPMDYTPQDMKDIDGFLFHPEAAKHLALMISTLQEAGTPVVITSGYRSYTDQQLLFAATPAEGSSATAYPGFSEHQSGLAVDLKTSGCVLDCFATTAQYAWMKEHAAEFGFIERYPAKLSVITGYKHEPWHWRYVGKQVAIDMRQKGLATLEAYMQKIAGYK